MGIKITGLTGLQVRAIREAIAANVIPVGEVETTATTATFVGDHELVTARVQKAIEQLGYVHGANRHPAKSLWAVRRKVAASE